MKTELITVDEARHIGLAKSRLLHEGHGAFGEPDNSYEYVVRLDGKAQRLSDDDLILIHGESPNREVIQIISKWCCSDKIHELLNPKALKERKKEKYEQYLKLKEEIENEKQ
jgi:hypothetical protein